jgi:ribonuclease HI
MVPRTVKRVSLITDGSCLGNPGPGGWACVLRFAGIAKELFGYDPHTTNRPVRNADLWIEFDELAGIHKTNWSWTKGHAGHDDNNRCDWLAQNAARKQISSWADGRAHGALRHDLGPDYVPPNPQAGLFEGLGVVEDEDDPSDPG